MVLFNVRYCKSLSHEWVDSATVYPIESSHAYNMLIFYIHGTTLNLTTSKRAHAFVPFILLCTYTVDPWLSDHLCTSQFSKTFGSLLFG